MSFFGDTTGPVPPASAPDPVGLTAGTRMAERMHIRRVANGFVVEASNDFDAGEVHVFQDPIECAEYLTSWLTQGTRRSDGLVGPKQPSINEADLRAAHALR